MTDRLAIAIIGTSVLTLILGAIAWKQWDAFVWRRKVLRRRRARRGYLS